MAQCLFVHCSALPFEIRSTPDGKLLLYCADESESHGEWDTSCCFDILLKLVLELSTAGPIPPELGKLAALKELYLHKNQLSGETLTGVREEKLIYRFWSSPGHWWGWKTSSKSSCCTGRDFVAGTINYRRGF